MSFILDAAHHIVTSLSNTCRHMLWPCVTCMFYHIYTLANYHVTLASLCWIQRHSWYAKNIGSTYDNTLVIPKHSYSQIKRTNFELVQRLLLITSVKTESVEVITTRAPPCSTHVPCSRPITSRTHQFSRSWVVVTTRTCEVLRWYPLAPSRIRVSSLYVHSTTICSSR